MYVCRPIAAVLVDLVKDTRITPNQITLSAVVVAVASAALLIVLPGHQGLIIAIAVYQASYVLDCADGMLARWRGIQSTPGHLLDFLMDEIKAFVILGAAAVRLFYDRADPRFLLLGIAGLVALASGIALTTFQRRPEIAPPAAVAANAPPPSFVKKMVRRIESVAKFLIHYPSYILLAAIAGHIEYYFYPYLAVNAVYALRTFASVALTFGRK
jgi:phosphatidylglycerophosphate synthase